MEEMKRQDGEAPEAWLERLQKIDPATLSPEDETLRQGYITVAKGAIVLAKPMKPRGES